MDIDDHRIELPRDLALLVRREVAEGAYATDVDMIRDAFNLLQERRAKLDTIRSKIAAAASDPEDITADAMRAHFEARFALLEAGKTP